MVNVVRKSKEENLLDQRCKELEKIVLERFKEAEINAPTRPYHFSIFFRGEHFASVYPDKNRIVIKNPKAYEDAYALAEQFEEKAKGHWTLKKEYNE